MGNKPYKNKVKEIEENGFEVGSLRNAAKFTRSLLNVSDYIQMKYNS